MLVLLRLYMFQLDTVILTQVDATLAAQVRSALLQVKRWEIVIAKCQAGTLPLQVTEFCESKELVW